MAQRTDSQLLVEFKDNLNQAIDGNSSYGLAALVDELEILKQTLIGARNDQLNRSAFSLGQLIAGNELKRDYVERKLEETALLIGLTEKEIIATIQSGIEAGMKESRSAPSENGQLMLDVSSNESDQNTESDWSQWKLYTFEDTFQDIPPTEYVVEGLFEKPSLNIVYAAPGSFKSFLMQDLSICIASGIDWLQPAPWKTGANPFKTYQCPTLWLDFDQGYRNTIQRFAALRKHYDPPRDTQLYFYSMPIPPLDGTNQKTIDYLMEIVLMHEIGFIVIDTLKAVSGSADENSGDMAHVMFSFRQVAEVTGAAIVLLHHQSKTGGKYGRAGDRLRGHSSIEAALDLALLIERENNADSLTVKATKSRGKDVYPFSPAFIWTPGENNEMETACFYGLTAEDTSSGMAVERTILEVLKTEEMNQKSLVEAVKDQLSEVGINTIRDRIDRLVNAEKLKESKGKRNEKIYKIT